MISLISIYDPANSKLDERVLRSDVQLVLDSMGRREMLAKQIAGRCGMTPAKARTLLSGMAQAGLVTYRPHPRIRQHPRPNLYRKATR